MCGGHPLVGGALEHASEQRGLAIAAWRDEPDGVASVDQVFELERLGLAIDHVLGLDLARDLERVRVRIHCYLW